MDKAADHKPDIRGFAISVRGVQGDSALGNGPAKSQDFLLINQEKFAFPKAPSLWILWSLRRTAAVR